MSTAKKHGPKLVRIEVHMVQGLRAALVEHIPDRGLIPITGKNTSGKTSLLRAINGAMGGAARVNERPVNDASEDGTGYTDILLDEGWRVKRHHTPANPKGSLYVKGPDGGKYGQAKLDELNHGADPDLQGFFGLPLARQTEILLGLGNDPDLPKKLAAKKAAWNALYDERTPAISDQRKARGVPRPEGDKPEPVDTVAAITEVRRLREEDRERQDAIRAVGAECASVERLARNIQEQESQVAKLRQQLAAAEDTLAAFGEDHKRRTAALDAERVRVDALPDPTEAIEAYMAHIASAEAIARSMRPWEAYEAAQVEFERATAEVDRITAAMKAVEDERLALVEAAEIPVAGLSFDHEGAAIYNGRQLEVASGGERVRIALAVAKAAGLGFTLIDEGDVLDDDMLAEIDTEAREEPGVQVLICSVGRSGPGLVQVVNGEARTVVAS